jgi:N-acetylglutamate synthase-like GNAT family acetyltransferase
MDTEIKNRISLRRATVDDRDFLLRVYAASRETELSVLPFDEAQKRAFVEHQLDAQTLYYQEKYPDATHEVILLEGEPVGRVYVNRGDNLISILDLAVLAEHRKKGIGTHIVKNLQSEASASDKRVCVYVETFNPSQKLFRELGFELVESDEVNLYFEWSACQ